MVRQQGSIIIQGTLLYFYLKLENIAFKKDSKQNCMIILLYMTKILMAIK